MRCKYSNDIDNLPKTLISDQPLRNLLIIFSFLSIELILQLFMTRLFQFALLNDLNISPLPKNKHLIFQQGMFSHKYVDHIVDVAEYNSHYQYVYIHFH